MDKTGPLSLVPLGYSPPPESQASRVYGILREEIQSGRLSQGTRLLEAQLARSLRVSRTPVREALRRLQAEGLVEMQSGRGLVVAELTIEAVLELYVAMIALEGMAASLAARLISPLELQQLQSLQRGLEEAVPTLNPEPLFNLNMRFHLQICAAAKNRYLLDFVKRIYDTLRRFKETTLTYPGRAQQMVVEHRALLTALEARDEGRAESLVREHNRNAMACRMSMITAPRERATRNPDAFASSKTQKDAVGSEESRDETEASG